tara:strand:- start:1 stop:234 length:234 start_codon:yes stop_codon:yes gene_type:complete
MIFNIFFRLFKIVLVVGSIYICWLSDFSKTQPLINRIFVYLLIGVGPLYYLIGDILSGGFLDPTSYDDDIGDDGGGF